ncbi:UNVERIFIED_CONTAM: hypothetical protein GTU68_028541, partial [Idotea baltica]|nr:hypothetical protein [Idotea baltica]
RSFPQSTVTRRNTDALDELLHQFPFNSKSEQAFNFCTLLTGSEGTLAMTLAIKLNLIPLPPPYKVVVAGHFNSLESSLKATALAVPQDPEKVEMMDHYVLDCTKGQKSYEQYRSFLVGEPQAIIAVELAAESQESLAVKTKALIDKWKADDLAYATPILKGKDIAQIWSLRSAGLGLLSNIKGDAKPIAIIEDTAVDVNDLVKYIAEFNEILDKYDSQSVHYAHAGAGELHLRPILNLKEEKDRKKMRQIATETAELVKKYRGSNSGEHGDGRVRAEFLELLFGEEIYDFFCRLKDIWDPHNIFNPGKIVRAPAMDEDLRYDLGQNTKQFDTLLDFSDTDGLLRMAEKCNGSGDCRKTHLSGGTMCPSYMATRDEKDTTRARANVLREVLTRSEADNPFANEHIKDVMDLCLSCKACHSECPSNVDVATLKAEFLHQYQKTKGISIRNKLFAYSNFFNEKAALVPSLYNAAMSEKSPLAKIFKKVNGIASKRTIPKLHTTTLRKWLEKNENSKPSQIVKSIYLFVDEFTNLLDTTIGIQSVELLQALGYEVKTIPHVESGRTFISKGLLEPAQQCAIKNVGAFKGLIDSKSPLVGIEPSCILSFKDEYLRLVDDNLREHAKQIATNTFLIEDFLYQEMQAGNIKSEQFHDENHQIHLHGHCHQKALSKVEQSAWLLGLPKNYNVEIIPSGCCGMAGSFGYEKEHYEVSMKIGELVLFPSVRSTSKQSIIAASGTSCRHQIKDGTQRTALHPVEILHAACKNIN